MLGTINPFLLLEGGGGFRGSGFIPSSPDPPNRHRLQGVRTSCPIVRGRLYETSSYSDMRFVLMVPAAMHTHCGLEIYHLN